MLLARFLTVALVAGAGVAGAANQIGIRPTPGFENGCGSCHASQHEIRMYPHYTIWDDLSFRVNEGHVELLGAVSQPYKEQDVERLVERMPGVASVTDEVKVLPLSPMDDRLRVQVARAILPRPLVHALRHASYAADSYHRRERTRDAGRRGEQRPGEGTRRYPCIQRRIEFRLRHE